MNKVAEILREAKRLIVTEQIRYSCNAILEASKIPVGSLEFPEAQDFHKAESLFREMFYHEDTEHWWGIHPSEERQKLRAEALELAALSAKREALYKEQENG